MSPPTHISAAKLYETSQKEIKDLLTQAPYLVFSTDSWTSRTRKSYLTVVDRNQGLDSQVAIFLNRKFCLSIGKINSSLFKGYKYIETVLLHWPKNCDTY